MIKYRIEGIATIEIVTIVKAETEQEALKIAAERDVSICCHGSEYSGHCVSENEFIPIDASAINEINESELTASPE